MADSESSCDEVGFVLIHKRERIKLDGPIDDYGSLIREIQKTVNGLSPGFEIECMDCDGEFIILDNDEEFGHMIRHILDNSGDSGDSGDSEHVAVLQIRGGSSNSSFLSMSQILNESKISRRSTILQEIIESSDQEDETCKADSGKSGFYSYDEPKKQSNPEEIKVDSHLTTPRKPGVGSESPV